MLFSAASSVTARPSSQQDDRRGAQFAIDKKISQTQYNIFISQKELQPWIEIVFPNEIKISSVKIAMR
jgi:hypothetical protein